MSTRDKLITENTTQAGLIAVLEAKTKTFPHNLVYASWLKVVSEQTPEEWDRAKKTYLEEHPDHPQPLRNTGLSGLTDPELMLMLAQTRDLIKYGNVPTAEKLRPGLNFEALYGKLVKEVVERGMNPLDAI